MKRLIEAGTLGRGLRPPSSASGPVASERSRLPLAWEAYPISVRTCVCLHPAETACVVRKSSVIILGGRICWNGVFSLC